MQPRTRSHTATRRSATGRGRVEASCATSRSRHWGLVGAALLVGLGAFAPSVALGALEPGIYFDRDGAGVGDRVVLFSAADYQVCFSLDASPGPAEWRVHLAAAGVKDPAAEDLIRVRGTWSSEDGALFFRFTVPDVKPGPYRGYVECADGRLDPSTTTLVVPTSPPRTDTGPTGSEASWDLRWSLALVAGISGFSLALGRLSRGRPASITRAEGAPRLRLEASGRPW